MTLGKIPAQKGTQIQFLSHELLFLAHSGQPYRGSVYINFKSKGESFNLVDFKTYLTSLRSQSFYAENIAYEIYHLINTQIKSKHLGVIVDLSARGGIQQRVCFGKKFKAIKKENIFQVS